MPARARCVYAGLSGGQRKRLNIGMELVAMPSLLMLDEPTSGLDAAVSQDVVEALKKMAQVGRGRAAACKPPCPFVAHLTVPFCPHTMHLHALLDEAPLLVLLKGAALRACVHACRPA